MGLFEKIFGSHGKDKQGQQWYTLNNYSDASWKAWSGDAFESDLVRASVDARARHISKLSVVLTGSGKPALQNFLVSQPNSWQTWSQFLYRLSVVLDLQCTAFIVPVYGDSFNVTGISVVVPSDFQLIDVAGTPWIRMKFNNGNIASDELKNIGIMTRFQYLSDYFGTGNSALDATLELIDIQRQGISEAAKNSATYRFMATMGNFTNTKDLANERKRFSSENLQSGGGLLLFPNTYKDIKELQNKQYSVDADQQKAIENRVFYYFGVNEAILNNSATPEQMDAFYEGAIEPFAVQLADVLTNMLFSERERSTGNRIQFSADRLSYMSTANKIQLIQQMSDRGEMLRNEARKILNLPELPDGNSTIIRGEYFVTQYDEDGNIMEDLDPDDLDELEDDDEGEPYEDDDPEEDEPDDDGEDPEADPDGEDPEDDDEGEDSELPDDGSDEEIDKILSDFEDELDQMLKDAEKDDDDE